EHIRGSRPDPSEQRDRLIPPRAREEANASRGQNEVAVDQWTRTSAHPGGRNAGIDGPAALGLAGDPRVDISEPFLPHLPVPPQRLRPQVLWPQQGFAQELLRGEERNALPKNLLGRRRAA